LFPLNIYQKTKIAASINKGKEFSSTLKMAASGFFLNTCTLVQKKAAAHKEKDSNAMKAVRTTNVTDMAKTKRKFRVCKSVHHHIFT
jgi:hypothetical protein